MGDDSRSLREVSPLQEWVDGPTSARVVAAEGVFQANQATSFVSPTPHVEDKAKTTLKIDTSITKASMAKNAHVRESLKPRPQVISYIALLDRLLGNSFVGNRSHELLESVLLSLTAAERTELLIIFHGQEGTPRFCEQDTRVERLARWLCECMHEQPHLVRGRRVVKSAPEDLGELHNLAITSPNEALQLLGKLYNPRRRLSDDNFFKQYEAKGREARLCASSWYTRYSLVRAGAEGIASAMIGTHECAIDSQCDHSWYGIHMQVGLACPHVALWSPHRPQAQDVLKECRCTDWQSPIGHVSGLEQDGGFYMTCEECGSQFSWSVRLAQGRLYLEFHRYTVWGLLNMSNDVRWRSLTVLQTGHSRSTWKRVPRKLFGSDDCLITPGPPKAQRLMAQWMTTDEERDSFQNFLKGPATPK